MSYTKMMKWNRKHPKGTKQWMGFNPSGITSQQITDREEIFISDMKAKTLEERKQYWKDVSEVIALNLGSWEWQWCAFKRYFVNYTNEVR